MTDDISSSDDVEVPHPRQQWIPPAHMGHERSDVETVNTSPMSGGMSIADDDKSLHPPTAE